jgi:hypothetical protein
MPANDSAPTDDLVLTGLPYRQPILHRQAYHTSTSFSTDTSTPDKRFGTGRMFDADNLPYRHVHTDLRYSASSDYAPTAYHSTT